MVNIQLSVRELEGTLIVKKKRENNMKLCNNALTIRHFDKRIILNTEKRIHYFCTTFILQCVNRWIIEYANYKY